MIERNWKKNNTSWPVKITQILVSLSINKILLEHSQAHLFLYWPWLFSHCKMNSCLWLQSLKYLLSGPRQKMFIYTCLKHQNRSGFQRSLLFSGAISRSYFAYKNSVKVSWLDRPWVLWSCWVLFLLLLVFFFFFFAYTSCFYQWKKTRFLTKACSTMDSYDLFLSIILTWGPTNIYLINYGGPSLTGTSTYLFLKKYLPLSWLLWGTVIVTSFYLIAWT